MTTTSVSVEGIRIDGASSLDAIHVFWINIQPGQGYATIICEGCAWTVYFGGMSGLTIQEFFKQSDTPYLLSKLGNSRILKGTKKDDAYLERIIMAIKTSLSVTPPVA